MCSIECLLMKGVKRSLSPAGTIKMPKNRTPQFLPHSLSLCLSLPTTPFQSDSLNPLHIITFAQILLFLILFQSFSFVIIYRERKPRHASPEELGGNGNIHPP